MSTEKIVYKPWYKVGYWSRQVMVCHQVQDTFQAGAFLHTNYTDRRNGYMALVLLMLSLIMCVTTTTMFLLKPLRMPFTAQMIAGTLLFGQIFGNAFIRELLLYPFAVQYILRTFSFLGFIFHSLILGVETNMNVILKRMNKKSAIISLSGFFVSLTFSAISLIFFVSIKDWREQAQGYYRIVVLNAQTFFMVTCNHLNDLGISNSELGRLACTISLVVDVGSMVGTFIVFELLPVLAQPHGASLIRPVAVVCFYVVIFGIFRPYVIAIVDQCTEEKKMKLQHLLTIIVMVLLIAAFGDFMGQWFAVFMFGLSLPEDPLASMLSKKLDTITTGLFFPIFCSIQGLQARIFALEPTSSFLTECGLIFGSLGKFFGTCISAMSVGMPLNNALALSLIMSCKGLFDIVLLGLWSNSNAINLDEYTVAAYHFLICSGALLPLVRCLYNPSQEYSNILGTSVMDINENNGTLKTMACVHNEGNVPGIVRLIDAFNPSRSRPIPLTVLQLIQLTGRATMPILGILDQVKSTGVLGPRVNRCQRVVENMSYLERMHHGYVRIHHFISVAQYNVMHNDICNLAYERDTNLLILPFHILSNELNKEKNLDDSTSLTTRLVNKKVLENAPCAIGILINRTKLHLDIAMTRVYRIAIVYIGGMDDYEALAYTNIFATNPSISVMIVWLKSPIDSDRVDDCDYGLIDDIRAKVNTNEKLIFNEVVVKDGAETSDFMMTLNDRVDLVVAGVNHDPNCGPLFGLTTDNWSEFPELGILGDILASSDFNFSVLLVHSNVSPDSM